VKEALHTCLCARVSEVLDEAHMHRCEAATVVSVLIENANEINDGSASSEHGLERGRVMNIGRQKVDAR
jgi:hypothetical protein